MIDTLSLSPLLLTCGQLSVISQPVPRLPMMAHYEAFRPSGYARVAMIACRQPAVQVDERHTVYRQPRYKSKSEKSREMRRHT